MSFDDRELTSAWGSRAPVDDREHRVRLIGRATRALLAGESPDDEARLFLASALSEWLTRGGSLEADYLRTRLRGSHRTASVIWRDSLIADEDSGTGRAYSADHPPTRD